ncbi:MULTISPECIES: NADPH-dependent FMN reductase [unclassified Avibacterium]|uniref:NADPH-dependent FMN reductase n=1 Tax=unclassified Avibacterium TaxID=2685287 RepID=UPI00202638C9|nr:MULTISPECIES: NAD(P)H-dependent oxidoreductase [unclassified Avibacterium]MCW9698893.1 NAD(P)H-dependent oxidoreductase [Avibacterium sp. 20-129]URL06891.1 NAD(P)H-dependent oxidoreductase [Avibacterium sp. 21-595]
MNISLIIGSLSKQSINRSIANYIVAQFPAEVKVQEVRIDDLPLYTQDRDKESVAEYDRVREQIKMADAVLIVSPEHNRAMPAATKNIIDIASRPYGQNLWQGKKVAIVTASPGAYGGINAGLQIRQSLQSIGANVLISPEVFLSRATQALNEQGEVADERTAVFLSKFAQTFIQWAKA